MDEDARHQAEFEGEDREEGGDGVRQEGVEDVEWADGAEGGPEHQAVEDEARERAGEEGGGQEGQQEGVAALLAAHARR